MKISSSQMQGKDSITAEYIDARVLIENYLKTEMQGACGLVARTWSTISAAPTFL